MVAPDKIIPVENCIDNFDSLVEQYPITFRKDVTNCITNKLKESFPDISIHESPSSKNGRHIYWIDESNQRIIP